MIKKEIVYILSGKYKNFHRAWLFSLFLIIYFFSPYPALAFSDNFESGLGNWYIVSGTWSNNAGYTGNGIQSNSVGVSYIQHNMSTSSTFWHFDFRLQTAIADANSAIRIEGDSSTNAIGVVLNSSGYCGSGIGTGSVVGFGCTMISPSTWYGLDITLQGTNINFTLYNKNTSVLVAQNIVNFVDTGYNNIIFYSNSGFTQSVNFDNVVASTTSPQAANTISWDKTSYFSNGKVGTPAIITWAVEDSTWNSIWSSITTFKIVVQKNGEDYTNAFYGTKCTLGVCSDGYSRDYNIPTQTGSVIVGNSPSGTWGAGVYNAKLCRSGIEFCDVLLANSSVLFFDNLNGNLFVNSSVRTKEPNNIQYSVSTAYSSGDIWIESWWKSGQVNPDGTPKYELDGVFSPATGAANTVYNYAWYPAHTGDYNMILRYSPANLVLATAITKAEQFQKPIQINVSSSFIQMDKTSYSASDQAKINYGIDNTNWSNYTNYIAFVNTTRNIQTAIWDFGGGEMAQVGYTYVVLGNGFGLASNTFMAGNVTAQLRAMNKTADFLLAQTYFDLSALDSNGYGLDVSKISYCYGESVPITATVPFGINGALTIIDMAYPNKNVVSFQVNGTSTYIFKPSRKSTYTVNLFDNNNITRKWWTFDYMVTGCPSPTATGIAGATPPTGEKAVSNLGDNLKTFMAMPAFWGLFITILLFFAVGKTMPSAMGFGMFLIMNIEAVIGLWYPYTNYILAVTWVFAGIYFTLGRKVLTGG